MQAVNALDKIAEIPFSKKSPEEPIQIVGLLESSALEFDRLWVMGCSLDNMPAKPSPNPFIPMELQKTHNLPHSTSERELKYSEQILARLMKSAPEIIFSYPAWQGNRETTISPLITALDRHEKAPIIELSHAPALQIANSATLETWEDPAQLPIAQDELAGVKGGQSILADMAKCPFRAFAVHRLHAQQLEEPEIDVDAASRGNTVHKAMELFWNDVRSQEKLINIYDADELPARVRKHVANAMKTQMNSFTHQPRFADLETERITHLILQWLESDLERPPFTVLDAEKNISLNVEGLNLTLQVDRIDKTKEGEIIIVDYKTGQANKNDWFGERLIQPQLPLYNLKTPASAIAFAKINKKQCGYEGVAKKNNIITGLDTDNYKTKTGSSNWEELMEFWRQKIHGLANSFISGQLIVDPADVKKTCEHCGLQSLCRVAEQKTIKAREETDA